MAQWLNQANRRWLQYGNVVRMRDVAELKRGSDGPLHVGDGLGVPCTEGGDSIVGRYVRTKQNRYRALILGAIGPIDYWLYYCVSIDIT
jgi:hypothetical protein